MSKREDLWWAGWIEGNRGKVEQVGVRWNFLYLLFARVNIVYERRVNDKCW